jgi:hypothetical protein
MENIMRPAIKLMYNLLAKPGLGNPHTYSEIELMAAGAKPVAIAKEDDITTELQGAIDRGDVLKINEHEFETRYKIYCRASELPDAEKAAQILERSWQEQSTVSDEDAYLLSTFFNLASDDAETTMAGITAAMRVVEADLSENEKLASVKGMIDGDVRATMPLRHLPGNQEHQNLDEVLSNSDVSSVDITIHSVSIVFAQADKEEDGKELDARYFQAGDGYPAVKDPDARVGELLGFTQNDIAWFNGTKYQNPFVNKLMVLTSDIRAEARKRSMLMDVEEQPFNAHRGASSLKF